MQPLNLQPQIQETHRTTHTGTTTRCKTQRRNQNEHRPHPPRTEGTFQRRLTLHGKQWEIQGFAPRLPPQNKTHATFMQPLQCVSQHPVSRRKLARIYAHSNRARQQSCSHWIIPMRSATTDSRDASNYAHRNNHLLQNTEKEPKRPQPHPPHTGGTF